jgi:hypothetical protein
MTTSHAAAEIRTAPMYKAYFVRRLLEALSLAEKARNERERSIHLQTTRYYRDIIESLNRRN